MIKKAICALCLFLLGCLMAESISAIEENKDLSLLLPINHLIDNKVSLSIKIDKSYKPLGQLPAKFMEFIPKNESENNWSEIFTVQTLVGVRTSASDFLGKLKGAMQDKAKTFKLLKEDSKELKSYTMSSFGAAYETGGRKEVVYMRYYSGPADLCGVQYAKVLKPGESAENVLKDLIAYVDKVAVLIELY
jgi:hypothetical protein